MSENCSCSHGSTNRTVQQTLTELDFERGIWSAAIDNEIDRVRNFVAQGRAADRDNFGYTALHYAARNGNLQICRMLISSGGVDVNAVTNGGASALHRAAMMGHLDIVKLLINSKANSHLQDEDGQTALHRSSARAHYAVCEYLVNVCSQLKFVADKKNQTPFDVVPTTNANDDLKSLLKP